MRNTEKKNKNEWPHSYLFLMTIKQKRDIIITLETITKEMVTRCLS